MTSQNVYKGKAHLRITEEMNKGFKLWEQIEITQYYITSGITGLKLFDTYEKQIILTIKDSAKYRSLYIEYKDQVMYTSEFLPYYKILTKTPQTLTQAGIKIGGLLALFKVAAALLQMFHKKRFERILQNSIQSDENRGVFSHAINDEKLIT